MGSIRITMSEKPVVEAAFRLERYPGKGGWTYVVLPKITSEKSKAFGWITASGAIDDYELKDVKLWPMKNGNLFLPVKAAIRKAIGKEEGDLVKITLYAELPKAVEPGEIIECIKEAPEAYAYFQKLNRKEQKEYLDWILSAKSDQTKVDRIVTTIDRLSKHIKYS